MRAQIVIIEIDLTHRPGTQGTQCHIKSWICVVNQTCNLRYSFISGHDLKKCHSKESLAIFLILSIGLDYGLFFIFNRFLFRRVDII